MVAEEGLEGLVELASREVPGALAVGAGGGEVTLATAAGELLVLRGDTLEEEARLPLVDGAAIEDASTPTWMMASAPTGLVALAPAEGFVAEGSVAAGSVALVADAAPTWRRLFEPAEPHGDDASPPVEQLAFTYDGEWLGAARADGLWLVRTSRADHPRRALPGPVRHVVALAERDELLASLEGAWWRVPASGAAERLGDAPGLTPLAVSPDGALALALSGAELVVVELASVRTLARVTGLVEPTDALFVGERAVAVRGSAGVELVALSPTSPRLAVEPHLPAGLLQLLASAADSAAGSAGAARLVPWLAPLLGAPLLLLGGLGGSLRAGLWDPYELDAIELARALSGLFGGPPPEVMPTLGDLGSGELPFTSMAFALARLGPHEWAARLPLFAAAWTSVWGVFLAVRRLVDTRAAAYAALATSSLPMVFLHARTLLGDGVGMAACALGWVALTAALAPGRALPRVAWAVAGVLGVTGAFLSRGWLLAVAPTLAGVAAAWALGRARTSRDRLADAVGVASSLVCLYALGRGARLLWLGGADAGVTRGLAFALLSKPAVEGTFDLPLRVLGHGLFPLSALAPLAVGRLLSPPAHVFGAARERELLLATSLLTTLGVGVAMGAVLAPSAGPLVLPVTPLVGVALALALRRRDRGEPASPALAIATAALAFVLLRDLTQGPDRLVAAFGAPGATVPKGFEATGLGLVKGAAAALVAFVALGFATDRPHLARGASGWLELARQRAFSAARTLLELWEGNLALACLVVEAALAGLAGTVYVGRRSAWASVSGLAEQWARLALHLWWAAPLCVMVAAAALWTASGLARFALSRARGFRGGVAGLGVVAAGLALSAGTYPSLARELSPKEAFDAAARWRRAGEPLGLLGVRAPAARYYGADDALRFADEQAASEFLSTGSERRWLVLHAEHLPAVNSRHRALFGANLPVLDATSRQVLLASSELGGAPNQNPLGRVVLDALPTPSRPLDAALDEAVELLGYDVLDARGAVVDTIAAQTPYELRFYLRVIGPLQPSWKAFLHVDKPGLRHNGDHALTNGTYPMALWRTGDVIVDTYELRLEPNFVPGEYGLFYGLVSGETRMPVSRGAHDDDRVSMGMLRVR